MISWKPHADGCCWVIIDYDGVGKTMIDLRTTQLKSTRVRARHVQTSSASRRGPTWTTSLEMQLLQGGTCIAIIAF